MKNLNLLLGIVIAFCITQYFSMLLLVESDKLALACYAAVYVVAFCLILHFGREKKVLILYAVVLGLFILSALWNRWFEAWINYASDYLTWLDNYLHGFANYDDAYGRFTLQALLLPLSFFSAYFVWMLRSLPVVMLVCFGCMAIPNNLDQSGDYIFVFALMFFALLLFLINHTLLIRAKKGLLPVADRPAYLARCAVMSMVIFVAAWVMPYSGSPAAILGKLDMSSLIPWIADFGYGGYTFNNRGLHDRLGGPISADKELMMEVTAEEPVYLYGAIYDAYTGQNWEITDKTTVEYSAVTGALKDDLASIRLVDTVYNMHVLDEYFLQEDMIYSMEGASIFFSYYLNGLDAVVAVFPAKTGGEMGAFQRQDMTISYANVRTKSIFVPIKTDQIRISLVSDQLMENTEGTVLINQYNGLYFRYWVSAYVPKKRTTAFDSTLRFLATDFENAYRVARDNSKYFSLSSFDLDSYRQYVDTIHEKYTALPEELPARIKELAQEVTKDCDNDYDRAKALESYVAENYSYRLDMPYASRSKDFVDEFLFEQKEGYCTYFASALTVLLRSIDIPARYAEGFMLKNSAKKEGVFQVANDQAHAWTDVFIAGYGWLQLEPTSSYNRIYYNGETVADTGSAGHMGIGSGTSGYMPSLPQMPSQFEYMGTPPPAGSPAGTEEPAEKSEINWRLVLLLAVPATLVVVLIGFILNFLRMLLLFSLDQKKENREVVKRLYKRILRMIRIYRLEPESQETLACFAKRIQKRYPACIIDFHAVTTIYEKARYGETGKPITDDEKQFVIEQHKLLVTGIRRDIQEDKAFKERYIKGTLL